MTISRFVNTFLIVMTILAFLAQFFIDSSTENIATSTIILFSGLSTILYFRWSDALETHPLSSFAIFGFCITSILGALLVQSASSLAVSDNLRQPLVTFSMLAVYLAIAIIAHSLYRLITKPSDTKKIGLIIRAFDALKVYEVPTAPVLAVVGFFGLFCVLLSRVLPVANGFSFFVFAPFLIPIYSLQIGKAYCNIKLYYIFLAFHTSVIVMLAMFFNARGSMLAGLAMVGLLFVLSAMRSQNKLTLPLLFRAAAAMLLAVVLSFPASDLVTAMVVVRNQRSHVSPVVMIENTIKAFNNPEKLEKYSKQQMAEKFRSSYDEYYIENPILARFVTTKFHDNAIYFAGRMSDKDVDDLIRLTGDFFWITLPQPFLDALKIDINKTDLQFSMGDVLANKAVGIQLGGFRTGSIFGQGSAIFGTLFPFVYFAMCFILFAALDIFSKRSANGVIVISVIGMLNLWQNFIFGITADSLYELFLGVVRGVPQLVLLYFITFSIAKFITRIFSPLNSFKSSLSVK